MYTGLYLMGVSCSSVLDSFSSVRDPQVRAALVSQTEKAIFLYPFIILGWAITIYSHFALLMLPLAMVCVAFRVGPEFWQEVDAWPPNFGSFKNAYSIRRFWGYTWHQQMRRTTSAPGAYLLSLLPYSFQKSQALPYRLLKRYFLIFAAFFVSGLIHAAGSYNVTRALNLPLSDGGEIKYFLLQGLAIMMEDFILWILGVDDRSKAKTSSNGPSLEGPSGFRVATGYLYTASFYIFTRVMYKAVPLAIAHGIRDQRGELFAAVELVRRGAVAVPGNFVTVVVNRMFCREGKETTERPEY